jgi:hypothetical protein
MLAVLLWFDTMIFYIETSQSTYHVDLDFIPVSVLTFVYISRTVDILRWVFIYISYILRVVLVAVVNRLE